MSSETGLEVFIEAGVTACNTGKVKRNRAGRYVFTFEPKIFAEWLYERFGSWQKVADALGHSKAYWMLIAKGERKMSRADENELRRRLWLPPKGITKIERMSTKALRRYLEERR